MKIWPVQDAKAKFSELLETCVSEGPQMVSKRGVVEAMLAPVAEWERLKASTRPSLKDLLLSDEGRFDLEIPPRVAAHFNVLPMTGDIFRLSAKLMIGRSDDVYEDPMIAATALVNRLTAASRNEKDFVGFGVKVVNPVSAVRAPDP